MAYMKLTILGAGGVDESDIPVDNLSMTTGSKAIAGRKKFKVSFWTRDADSKEWDKMDNEQELTFLFTPQYVEFHKQMYSPNSIEAYILIKPLEIGSVKYKAFLSKEQLNNLFATRKVSLECDGKKVCDDYYIHEFIPRKYADQMYVTLKIFSPDKMMTLEKYCRTWTAKRLGAEILGGQKGYFGINRPTPKTDGTGQIDDITPLKCDTSNMKHIMKGGNEHIFPYLVQYNETFYDFLARTTNRWGEFLYYEDGMLQIGFNDKKVQEVNNYDVMTYCGWNSSQPAQSNAGVCVDESPYDNNTLKSVVKQDGYDVVKNTILQAFSPDDGADVYWMKKAGQLLTNNKSITNFVFNTMVDDFLAAGATTVQVSSRNSKNYDEYFKEQKTTHGDLPKHDDATKDKKEKKDQKDKGVHYSSSDGKETYNEFSEATPILDEKVYKDILKGELKAAENVVSIEFDTVWPDLKLGQLIKIDDEQFIVVEVVGYQPETAKKSSQSYYEKGYNSKVVKYRVTAIAQVMTGFYPPVLPTGHVRKSGPQIAVVVDVDDPLRSNRVRVEYPWQLQSFIDTHDEEIQKQIDDEKDDDEKKELKEKLIGKYEKLSADNLKEYDVSEATPWLLYASPSGPKKAGVHARHYLAEKVMVDFSNGNVERPFVVGAVSQDVPVPLKTGSAVLRAPNGEQVKVHEGAGKGAAAFIANLSSGMKLINSFYPFSFTPDNEVSRCFEGGVEIGDKYGIWTIKGSTDGRNVSIASPWGDVNISAFTGITLSAPNGNIKIEGKNIEISAGNNLKLTSGTNIKNKFASLYDGSKKHNVLSWATDVSSAVAKKVATMVASMVDLSLLRSVVEVFWKPQEGTLSVSSNRFLKLEAGGSKAGFPDTLYKNPEKKHEEDYERNKKVTLHYGEAMAELVKKVGSVVDKVMLEYKNTHSDYRAKARAFNDAVDSLGKFSNDVGKGVVRAVCNNWDAIKGKIWADDTEEINASDLNFNNDVVGDEKEADVKNVNNIMDALALSSKIGRHRKMLVLSKKEGAEAKQYIMKMRKDKKMAVLNAANEVLKSVKRLKGLDVSKANDGVGYTFGAFTYYVPEDYIKMMQDAFNSRKCEGSAFYTFVNSNIDNDDLNLANVDLKPLALKRRVALNLVDGWGAKPTPIMKKINQDNQIVPIEGIEALAQKPSKPTTDAEFEGPQWTLYVESLKFTDEVDFFKKASGPLSTFIDTLLNNVSFWKPISEYYSWGTAKSGQILFAQGNSYYLNPAAAGTTISALPNSKFSKDKLKRADLGEEDTRKLDDQMTPIRNALLNIKAAEGQGHGQGNDGAQEDNGVEPQIDLD